MRISKKASVDAQASHTIDPSLTQSAVTLGDRALAALAVASAVSVFNLNAAKEVTEWFEAERSRREIVELTMVVGFYVSTAILIKALAIPDEEA